MERSTLKNILIVGLIAMLIVSSMGGIYGYGQPYTTNEENSLTELDDVVKDKTIYLHNETGTVNENPDVTTMNTTMGVNQHITEWDQSENIFFNWYLDPPLADNFTLLENTSLHIWMVQKDATGETNFATLYLDLFDVAPDGSEVNLGTHSQYYGEVRTTFAEYSVRGAYEHTFQPGHSIRAQLRIESNAQVSTSIAYGDSEYPSRLVVGTDTYIKPESMAVLDADYNESYTHPITANETVIHFNTTIIDPFGGYDIWGVFITLEGPDGIIFENIPMDKTMGTYTSYRTNYTYSWNYSDAEEGDYLVTISAVDMTGYHYRYPGNPGDETYGGHLESINRTFWIGAERFGIHFKTIDSLDEVMTDAVVNVYTVPGDEFVRGNKTNEDGITNISLRQGTYTIRVIWQDMVVHLTTDYTVTNHISYDDPEELECDVYYPEYKIVDIAYQPVRSANLYIGHPNGTMFREISGADGSVRLSQMALGDYTIRVEWLGREVASAEHYLDGNVLMTIDASIYYLTIETVDTAGDPVPEVHVSIRFNDTDRVADAKLTDINGEVTIRLPGTQSGFGYNIDCYWRDVEVGEHRDLSLLANESLTITLDIFYIQLHTRDTLGFDLENTRLVAYNVETGALANSGVTDESGLLTMRLPRGEHEIVAYWRGIHVATHIVYVTGSTYEEIICEVYHVDFTTVDSREEILTGARVTVSHVDVGFLSTSVTDMTGSITVRVPGAVLNVEVEWKGVIVYWEEHLIDANTNIMLECAVYYVTVNVIDDLEYSVEGAVVNFYHQGVLLDSVTTDNEGITPEFRLPGTVMDLSVLWRSVEVYTGDMTLVEDTSITLQVAIYHVTFYVVDNLEEYIDGARISVYRDEDLIHTATTQDGGYSDARIPGASLRVRIEWKTVLVYDSDVMFDASETVVLYVEDVYHVSFSVVDSRREAVYNARVHFYVNDMRFESGATDDNGLLTIRVPTPVGMPGDIDINVYWKDVEVYGDMVQVDSNRGTDDPEILEADIFYLEYYVRDQRGVPVEDAKVIGTHAELPDDQNVITDRLTDENGYIEFRLPRGPQHFNVYWRDVVVRQESFDLSEDREIVADAHIYYLTVSINDDRGVPLEAAHIRLTYADTPRLFQSNYTDATGEVEIRIPAERWDIEIKWLKNLIYEGTHEVTANEDSWELETRTRVYYLTVRTVDRKGEPLEDVLVNVHALDQKWSGYTTEEGYTFRLPARDDYTVEASFKTTYLLTHVDLREDRSVTLNEQTEESVEFEEYPVPIYKTNLFLVLLGMILVLLAFAVISVLRRVKRGIS